MSVKVRAGFALDPPGFEGLAYATAASLAPAQSTLSIDAEWLVLSTACAQPDCATEWLSAVLAGPQPAAVEAAVAQARHGTLPDNPRPLTADIGDLWLYEAHPYGHLATGRRGSLDAITPAHAQRFFDQHYVRSTMVVWVDSEPLAEAVAPVLESVSTALPVDFPLQQPLPVQQPRAVIVDSAGTDATAVVSIAPDAVDDLAQRLPSLPSTVSVEIIGGPDAALPRRQAHLRVTATGKTGHYAALALHQALHDMRCEADLQSILANPTVVLRSGDPDRLRQTLAEEVPASRVYCTQDEHTVPFFDVAEPLIIATEDLFQ